MTYRDVDADSVDQPIVRHTGTATTLPTTGDNALYYHRAQQYSIIGLTNAAETLVERYSYTAYGTLGIYDPSGTVRTTSTYANRYTYTGREYDPDLNLYHYHFRARLYDPSTGGFISRDPLGYVDGMSLYRGYFGVRFTDPLGTTLKVGRWAEQAEFVQLVNQLCPDGNFEVNYWTGYITSKDPRFCEGTWVKRIKLCQAGLEREVTVYKLPKYVDSCRPVSCKCLCDAITSTRVIEEHSCPKSCEHPDRVDWGHRN